MDISALSANGIPVPGEPCNFATDLVYLLFIGFSSIFAIISNFFAIITNYLLGFCAFSIYKIGFLSVIMNISATIRKFLQHFFLAGPRSGLGFYWESLHIPFSKLGNWGII